MKKERKEALGCLSNVQSEVETQTLTQDQQTDRIKQHETQKSVLDQLF